MKAILDRVEAEISAGRPWRAKEIIRGNMRTGWPGAAVVERYGQLLLEVGERLEAGKFLFLSGVRTPHYAEAIELFLARHGGKTPGILIGQFPRSFRQLPFADLPEDVRAELQRIGVTAASYNRLHEAVPATPLGWRGVLGGAMALALVIIAGVGIVGFFGAVFFWVIDLFR